MTPEKGIPEYKSKPSLTTRPERNHAAPQTQTPEQLRPLNPTAVRPLWGDLIDFRGPSSPPISK